MKTTLGALVLMTVSLSAGVAQAQFSVSNVQPVFTTLPTSSMGTVLNPNGLTLTTLPNGFIVSGTLQISIPPGASSGVLAQYTVERRVDPTYSGSGIQTSTILTGFSTPPVGTFVTTTGTVDSTWRHVPSYALVGGSTSSVPMTLINGIDSPAWSSLTASSSPFTWTAGFSTGVLQQQFTLMGNYSGPGGTWLVDVPVTSLIVPEPSSMALAAMGLAGMAAWGLRRKRV